MDSRTKIGILLIVYSIQVTVSAPTWDSSFVASPSFRVRRSEDKATGRIFWSAVGDVLESLPFLPFTVNVPDAISSMWSYVTGFFSGTTSRPSGDKKPKRNSTTQLRITGEDLVDYFLD